MTDQAVYFHPKDKNGNPTLLARYTGELFDALDAHLFNTEELMHSLASEIVEHLAEINVAHAGPLSKAGIAILQRSGTDDDGNFFEPKAYGSWYVFLTDVTPDQVEGRGLTKGFESKALGHKVAFDLPTEESEARRLAEKEQAREMASQYLARSREEKKAKQSEERQTKFLADNPHSTEAVGDLSNLFD